MSSKSEPQLLGRNDASPPNNPNPYRLIPNLGKSDWVYDDGGLVVKPEEIARNNGSRVGHNG